MSEPSADTLQSGLNLLHALQDPSRHDHAQALGALESVVRLGQSDFGQAMVYLFSRGTGDAAEQDLHLRHLAGMLVKWGIVKPIKAYINQMTYAIQPHANGGKSLPDLINKVDALHVVVQNHLTTSHNTPISPTCLCKSDWHA